MSLSDCIKLCQFIRCQLPETCRLQRECGIIASTANSIVQALTAQAKTVNNDVKPDVGISYQELYAVLEEAASVINDCSSCGAVRGLLIARSLHRRAVEAVEHLAEAQHGLPWATAQQVAAEHAVPDAVVATGGADGYDDTVVQSAARFEHLVLKAGKHAAVAADKEQVLQEVVSLLLQQPRHELSTGSHQDNTGTRARLAQHPAFGDLPIPLLEAEVVDLRLPRVGGDKHVLRMQMTVASIIEERLFELDVAPKDLRCPLTHRLFKEPVVLVETGLVYDRTAIEEWLAEGNTTDPVTGADLTSGAVVPNVLLRQLAQEWAVHHARKKRRQQLQRKRQLQRQRQQQQQQQPADLALLLQQEKLPEAVLAAELAAHCGYVYIRQLTDQSMFGASRALLVRCNRTNRLRTLLQIPRAQLQQLNRRQRHELVGSLQQASDLHHPHTLQVQEVFLGPLHLHIVLEECSAGRLVDFPVKQHSVSGAAGPGGATAALSPDFARWFFQQVMLAVEYCHTKGLAGLAVEAAVLKIVPGVPQPVVKVATPLLAHGLSVLCAATQPAACSTTGQPADQQQQTSTASAADLYKTDMYACGVLLLKLLGVDLQHQQQDWQQQLRLMSAQQPHQQHEASLTALLQGLLETNPDQRFQVADVKANTWFQQQLPPAAEGMAARYVAKGRACRQSVEEVAAVVEVAWLQQMKPHLAIKQLAQKLRSRSLSTAVATGSTCLQQMPGLQLLALQQAAAELTALCSSPGLQLLPAAAAASVLRDLVQHMCVRVAAAVLALQQQQMDTVPLLLLISLQQSCSNVLLSTRLLLGVLQDLQHQTVQQPQVQDAGSLHNVIMLHSQLLHGAWQLLPSACGVVAVANRTINLGSCSKPALQRPSLPPLPQTAAAVASKGCLLAAQQALVGAVLLPLVNMPINPLSAASTQDVAMLPSQLPLSVQQSALGAAVLWQALAAAVQLQKRTPIPNTLAPCATAEEMFGALTFTPEQQQPASWAHGRVTFNANCGQQPVQVVGLSSLHSTQEGRSTAAAPHPDLSLVSAACTPEASAQLAATLQELLRAGVHSQVLAPITGMCLDPPLLVVPQPPKGTLERWVSTAAGKVDGTNRAKDDFTAAWVASMSWSKVLQVLVDVAAALSLLHQQQQPVVHGGVHAAAVHLLQQLTHKGDTQQQQQQQEAAAQSPGQVCQLSLVGLLSQVAPIRSCHPFLAAPEVVLAAGPATAAADVYGFGVLMFQLATGWLPQQYIAGTDEQICAVMWCREMLAQVGSTSPLAAAQQVLQQKKCSRTPYGHHMPSCTALKQLPAGYVALMEDCLHRVPPARPVVQEVLARVEDIAGGRVQPMTRPSLLLEAAAVQAGLSGQGGASVSCGVQLLGSRSSGGFAVRHPSEAHRHGSGQAAPASGKPSYSPRVHGAGSID